MGKKKGKRQVVESQNLEQFIATEERKEKEKADQKVEGVEAPVTNPAR